MTKFMNNEVNTHIRFDNVAQVRTVERTSAPI